MLNKRSQAQSVCWVIPCPWGTAIHQQGLPRGDGLQAVQGSGAGVVVALELGCPVCENASNCTFKHLCTYLCVCYI